MIRIYDVKNEFIIFCVKIDKIIFDFKNACDMTFSLEK